MSFAKYPVSGGGSGNVTGPGVSTNNGVVLFDGTSGAVIKDLGVGLVNQVLLTNGTTPSWGPITNQYISSAAAIAFSKMAALTINRALISNSLGVIAESSVTSTELGYLSGVTSAIQTQLNGKVGTSGNQTIAGSKTFSSAVTISLTTNQLVLGTTNTVTISSTAPSVSRVYTIPDAGGAADFILSAGSQTIGGSKTLSSAVTINPASNQVILSTGVNQLTLNSGTSAAARTYTIPDTGTTDTFAMLGGAQAFTALKTFNSGLTLNGGSAANLSIWSASNVLRQRGGTSGWAVDNTSGNTILSATDAGTFTLGVAGTNHEHTFNGNVFNHINSAARSVIQVESTSTAANADAFISHKVNGDSNYWSTGLDRSADAFVLTRGANRDVSTDTSLISVSSTGAVSFGTVSNVRGLLNRTNTTGLDRVFLNHEIDSVVSYGVGVDSSNAFTIGTTSALNSWGTKFFNATSTGAVTLGPPSKIGSNDFAGASIVGRTNGTAVAAGYVGEVRTFTSRTVTPSVGNWAVNTTAMDTLTPGVWLVYCTYSFSTTSSTNVVAVAGPSLSTTAGVSIQTQTSVSLYNTFGTSLSGVCIPFLLTISSNTPIYAQVYFYNATTATPAIGGYAVRIA